MRHDEPANVMHLIKPLLLMIALLLLMFVAELASADTVRVHDAAGSNGPEITLASIAELTGEYAPSLGGVVVGRFESGEETIQIQMDQVRAALVDAGAAVGRLNLQGFSACKVYRTREEPAAVERAEPTDNEPPVANTYDEQITVTTPTTVRGLIVDQVAKTLGVAEGDLEFGFAERDGELLSRSSVAGRYTVEAVVEPRLGTVSFRVREFRGTQQVSQSTITANIRQRVLAVVAADTIGRGEVIHRGLICVREVLIDDKSGLPVSDLELVVGQVSSRQVEAGQIVTAGSVVAPIAVRRREQVEVTLDQGGLRITFTGVAQGEGSVGQNIEVKNLATDQTFNATVTGPRRVRVGEIKQEAKGPGHAE